MRYDDVMSAKATPAVVKDDPVWEALQRAPVNASALTTEELDELDAQMASPGTEVAHADVERIVAERAKRKR